MYTCTQGGAPSEITFSTGVVIIIKTLLSNK